MTHKIEGGKSMIKSIVKSALVVGLLIFTATTVFAHAALTTATPAANATVTASPSEIILTFSEAIDLKFSGAKIADAGNAEITTGPASLAKDDDKTLVIPLTATLAAGEYSVTWHNLSRDGHKIKGTFKFTVKP
jgi:methionine-rich copper-binding protein CopC